MNITNILHRTTLAFLLPINLIWSANTVQAADVKPSPTAQQSQGLKDVSADPVVETLSSELKRNYDILKKSGKAPLYFLEYRLYEGTSDNISASDGALRQDNFNSPWRILAVDLRVGSPLFDNTHFLRGSNSSASAIYEKNSNHNAILSAYGAGIPLRECLWLKTNDAFRDAQQRFSDLMASNQTLAAEEDKSGDFSLQPARSKMDSVKLPVVDRVYWENRVRDLSKIFCKYPNVLHSGVSFNDSPQKRYIVTTEGSKIIDQQLRYTVSVIGSTLADDGMNLWLYIGFDAPDPSLLPSEEVMAKATEKLANKLEQLRQAPPAESFVGPAILAPRAAAVFFHETFGHRVESVHEKNANEGKTFVKKFGTLVMSNFINVVDDPTVSKMDGEYLNGHYAFDDEGVPAQKVVLVKDGILKELLRDRTPVMGLNQSNGHGRSSPGWNPIARQANLIVSASPDKSVSPQALRAQLIAEAKKQHKAYGLLFEDISGGYTFTSSSSDQTYRVTPLVVYKVFVDGSPDQLIRGAEIVGTPLAALEKIIAAGTDTGVFNGICGRDSGPVPVSAVAPSLLIQSMEIKRTNKSYEKLPILPDPTLSLRKEAAAETK